MIEPKHPHGDCTFSGRDVGAFLAAVIICFILGVWGIFAEFFNWLLKPAGTKKPKSVDRHRGFGFTYKDVDEKPWKHSNRKCVWCGGRMFCRIWWDKHIDEVSDATIPIDGYKCYGCGRRLTPEDLVGLDEPVREPFREEARAKP